MQDEFSKKIRAADLKMEWHQQQIQVLKQYKKSLLAASELSKKIGENPSKKDWENPDEKPAETAS